MTRKLQMKYVNKFAAGMTAISLGVSILFPTTATAQVLEVDPVVADGTTDETQVPVVPQEEGAQPAVIYTVDTHEFGPGYEMEDPTISVEKEREAQTTIIHTVQVAKAAEEEAARIAELEQYILSVGLTPDDVSRITNLKLEDMHLLTEGTWWAGEEEALYDLEHTYGINACYAMAVSTLESGHGTTSRARNKNEVFGMTNAKQQYFSTRHEDTMYFGDIMHRNYVGQGRLSVEAIGTKYCPPNRKWEVYMRDYMNKRDNLQAKLRAKYGL